MISLYLARHCRAAGQEPDAPLTAEGEGQARALADLLAPLGVTRIVASPYERAVRSAAPLAARSGLEVETDARLVERVLSLAPLAGWLDALRASFADPSLALPGGESGDGATARALAAIEDALAHPAAARGATVLVTHGNLLSLVLQRLQPLADPEAAFARWQSLSNPDVFLAQVPEGWRAGTPTRTAGVHVERVWPA